MDVVVDPLPLRAQTESISLLREVELHRVEGLKEHVHYGTERFRHSPRSCTMCRLSMRGHQERDVLLLAVRLPGRAMTSSRRGPAGGLRARIATARQRSGGLQLPQPNESWNSSLESKRAVGGKCQVGNESERPAGSSPTRRPAGEPASRVGEARPDGGAGPASRPKTWRCGQDVRPGCNNRLQPSSFESCCLTYRHRSDGPQTRQDR